MAVNNTIQLSKYLISVSYGYYVFLTKHFIIVSLYHIFITNSYSSLTFKIILLSHPSVIVSNCFVIFPQYCIKISLHIVFLSFNFIVFSFNRIHIKLFACFFRCLRFRLTVNHRFFICDNFILLLVFLSIPLNSLNHIYLRKLGVVYFHYTFLMLCQILIQVYLMSCIMNIQGIFSIFFQVCFRLIHLDDSCLGIQQKYRRNDQKSHIFFIKSSNFNNKNRKIEEIISSIAQTQLNIKAEEISLYLPQFFKLLVIRMTIQNIMIISQIPIFCKTVRFQILYYIIVCDYHHRFMFLLVLFYQLFYFQCSLSKHIWVLIYLFCGQHLKESLSFLTVISLRGQNFLSYFSSQFRSQILQIPLISMIFYFRKIKSRIFFDDLLQHIRNIARKPKHFPEQWFNYDGCFRVLKQSITCFKGSFIWAHQYDIWLNKLTLFLIFFTLRYPKNYLLPPSLAQIRIHIFLVICNKLIKFFILNQPIPRQIELKLVSHYKSSLIEKRLCMPNQNRIKLLHQCWYEQCSYLKKVQFFLNIFQKSLETILCLI